LEDEGHWKRGTFPKTRKLKWVVAQSLGINSKRRAVAH
jgi:hypothetical protein